MVRLSTSYINELVNAVFEGKYWVSVYGAGYVGRALATVFLRAGAKVILVDINEERLREIKELRFSKCTEEEIRSALSNALRSGRIKLVSNGIEASRLSKVKLVTVPVLYDSVRNVVNYDPLVSACEDIARGLKEGDLIVIESSVPPGTTEEVVKPLIESVSGLRAEEDFLLAYSPERIYVGRAVKDIEVRYPKVVSGVGPLSLEAVTKLYSRVAKAGIIKASSTKVAEFSKLAEGAYRDVNIALANQLALLAMKLGIDYYEVVRIANTQPYSHLHLPGPGVGGYCVPIYPRFLMIKAEELGIDLPLLSTSRLVNELMPYKVFSLIREVIKLSRPNLSDVKVAVLGAAFRGGIDDTRLSPTHDLLAIMKSEGFKYVVVHDPYVRNDSIIRELGYLLTNDLSETLKDAELVIVMTRHKVYEGLRTSTIKRLCGKSNVIVIDAVAILNHDSDVRYIALGKPTQ